MKRSGVIAHNIASTGQPYQNSSRPKENGWGTVLF